MNHYNLVGGGRVMRRQVPGVQEQVRRPRHRRSPPRVREEEAHRQVQEGARLHVLRQDHPGQPLPGKENYRTQLHNFTKAK